MSFKIKKSRAAVNLYFRPPILNNEKKIEFLNNAVFIKAHLLIVSVETSNTAPRPPQTL